MVASLSFRLARATVFAVVCTALGVFAHLFAGGTVTEGEALTALAVAFGCGALACGRERGLRTVLGLLSALQVALHLVFSAVDPISHAGGPHSHALLVPGLGMLVMHGWAVVVTALWLARGEAALWSVLRRIGVRLGLRLPPLPGPVLAPFPVIALTTALTTAPAPRSAPLKHALNRRGPPPSLSVI